MLFLALTKKDREQQGYTKPVKPILEQHLVTDFTPEALTDVHKFNKRGIGVYADELARGLRISTDTIKEVRSNFG